MRDAATQVPNMAPEALDAVLASIPKTDPWLMLHGKDTVSVLQIGLLQALGTKQRSFDEITMLLRLAFDDLLFGATGLYESVREWESRNPPFRVWREDLAGTVTAAQRSS